MAVSFLLSDNNTWQYFKRSWLYYPDLCPDHCRNSCAHCFSCSARSQNRYPRISDWHAGFTDFGLHCTFSIFKPSVSYRFSGLEIHPAAAFIYSRFNFIFTDVLPFIAVFRNGLTVFPAFYRCLLCCLYFCGINKIFISDSRTHPAVSCPK